MHDSHVSLWRAHVHSLLHADAVRRGVLVSRCAWCGAIKGEEPSARPGVTDGICAACIAVWFPRRAA